MRAALTMRAVVTSLFLVALICLFKGGVAAQDEKIIRVTTREVFFEVPARRGYYLPQKPSVPAKGTISTATNKAEAEQAIRKTLYTLEYAYATGDIETVRRLTAKRTLDLYRLCFSLLSKDSGLNADDLFARMVSAVAAAAPQMSPEKIKEQAQKNADRPITFIDDKTARIVDDPSAPASVAVLEEGIWKIDDTEMVKEDFLKSDGLTSADKKRIKDF